MTFSTYETSIDDGQPFELLLVSCLTNHWSCTTAETAFVYDGNTYLPLPFSHDVLIETGDVAKSQLTFKVPQDCLIGELFRVQPPSAVVTVTLFQKHAPDADVKAVWKGRIVNSDWQEPWLHLTGESVYSSMQRTGLRRKFCVQCPLALYETGVGQCNVDRATFRETYTVSAVSGAVVTCSAASGKVADWYAGGFATWTHGTSGYVERQMISTSDTAGHVTLLASPTGLTVGASIDLYPGCDHTETMCDTKFSNSLNNGGMKYIPKKNPFDGTAMY